MELIVKLEEGESCDELKDNYNNYWELDGVNK